MNRKLVFGGERGDFSAQHQKRTDDDRHGAAGQQVGDGGPNRGTGVDDIIHHGHAFFAQTFAQVRRRAVSNRVKSGAGFGGNPFGKIEIFFQRGGHALREESASRS